MEKPITMTMIAQKCGTSIGTVDRALNNRPGISAKTRQRVLDVAAQLGYTPNRFAGALSRKKTIRIGMVYSHHPQDFYRDMQNGIQRAGAELAGYGVQIDSLQSPTLSPADQLTLLRSTDLAAYDGLAVNSAGGTQTDEIINTLTASGMPVITFNTDAPASNRLFYVGSSSLQSGRLGAELMGKLLGGQGQVATLANFMDTTTYTQRLGGFASVMRRQYPAIDLVACTPCQADSRKAQQIIAQAILDTPQLSGIFCASHTATIGAVAALQQLARKDIKLIGHDLGSPTTAALREGWCDALLYQDPSQQGYQAARLLARHLLEGWLPQHKLLHISTQILLAASLGAGSSRDLTDGLFL